MLLLLRAANIPGLRLSRVSRARRRQAHSEDAGTSKHAARFSHSLTDLRGLGMLGPIRGSRERFALLPDIVWHDLVETKNPAPEPGSLLFLETCRKPIHAIRTSQAAVFGTRRTA
jgi:hypothetical protein